MSEQKAADFTDSAKRQHVSDAAWEQMSADGWFLEERKLAETRARSAGLVIVTVAEWDRGSADLILVAESCAKLCSEMEGLRAQLADRDETIARLRNAPPFPPALEKLRSRLNEAQAEADRLRRVLHAERQPVAEPKKPFRWSPMV